MKINGVEIHRVVEIICNNDTNYDLIVRFHYDSRLPSKTDISKLMIYELNQYCKEEADEVGVMELVIKNEANTEIDTTQETTFP